MKKRSIVILSLCFCLVVAIIFTFSWIRRDKQDVAGEEAYANFPPLYQSPDEYKDIILDQYGSMTVEALVHLSLSTLDPSRDEMVLALMLRKEETLPMLKRELIESDNELKLDLLMLVQGRLRWEELVPEIMTVLQDESVPDLIRSRAATAAALFQRQEATATIRSLLAGTDDLEVKWLTTIALGHLDDKGAEGLIQLSLQDDSPFIRVVAAGVLGMLGSASGESEALNLSRHERFDVRLMAADALSYIGTAAAMDRLREMAASDPSPSVAMESAESLLRAEIETLNRAAALKEIKQLITRDASPWAMNYLLQHFVPDTKKDLHKWIQNESPLTHAATLAILNLEAEIYMIPYVRRPLK